MRGKNFMTLLKNAKNGQNAHHSIESTLLSQSPTVKDIPSRSPMGTTLLFQNYFHPLKNEIYQKSKIIVIYE